MKVKKGKKKYNESLSDDDDDENYTIIKKGNKRKKIKKQNLKRIPLDDSEQSEIIDNNNLNKIPITKTVETEKCNIKTKYLFSSESKNFIYYSCYKKKYNCKGTAKVDKINKKFIITCFCDYNIAHLDISYNDFINLMNKKNIMK